ncbi:hypothetical protein KL905_001532 [Ogataea polymorpha]|uniref:Uncharacterized protein n=1 Tax=Ogataea polymorpha TaxID=460523 RepID=A0A1B7SM33_9ASCO|nr:uncharacterized protein OGAPODRAFT_92810 [Ogataea polymorpha]KAG7880039.1 hypothetical protein KL937_002923 [Ogataea polymorpha]KAG7893129.1 hypothetical protein KL936_001303 [Ogataea polymorpha]KAG7897125.1 hypothetical protein KL908_000527 [Ogataea polymorpha]KAG7903068.1 hypothetical protein KL935_000600 [Ogataea polymorpha]KAG7912325.1 hypothetical protein KL906_000529 [Ogataea polymorpha]
MSDPTAKLESFLKTLLKSLDQPLLPNQPPDAYAASVLPQLQTPSRVIVNGTPYGSKQLFQQTWATLPASQHQLLSYDAHLIPTGHPQNIYSILARVRVRFDESGRNRLGETADLVPVDRPARPLYSPWFGVSLYLIADEQLNHTFECECISSFNYRVTEQPEKSVFHL